MSDVRPPSTPVALTREERVKAQTLRRIKRSAGLLPGKRYDTEGHDYEQAVQDVRFLLGLLDGKDSQETGERRG